MRHQVSYLIHPPEPVSSTHLRAHETPEHLVCRLLLETKQLEEGDVQHGFLLLFLPGVLTLISADIVFLANYTA